MDQGQADRLPDLIGAMEEFIDQLGLDEAQKRSLRQDILAVKSLLFAGGGQAEVVRQYLDSIYRTLRSGKGGRIAAAAMEELRRL